jgi:hypothetical protein
MMLTRLSFQVLLLCLVVLVQGCTTTPAVTDMVVVHYRQSANLYSFEIPNTTSECVAAIARNQSQYITTRFWAVYEITSIENKDQKPLQFNFYLNKVYYRSADSTQKSYPGFGWPEINTCLQTAGDAVVAPNTVSPYIGRFFVAIPGGDPSMDQHAEFHLSYDAPIGQPVIFVEDPGIKPSYVNNSPAGLPIWFGQMAVVYQVSDILKCTSQLNAPAGCVTE